MTEDNAGSVSEKHRTPQKQMPTDRLFDFIVTEIKEQGAAPSYEQICSSLGYSKGLVSGVSGSCMTRDESLSMVKESL
jgi:hypothetical protein